jgi:hypothetical protein
MGAPRGRLRWVRRYGYVGIAPTRSMRRFDADAVTTAARRLVTKSGTAWTTKELRSPSAWAGIGKVTPTEVVTDTAPAQREHFDTSGQIGDSSGACSRLAA